MVRPLLLSAGSRGDFEPMLALAESPDLESPILFIQSDYQSLAPDAHLLPFTVPEMMPSFQYSMSVATKDENPFETMWRAIGHTCANVVLPSVDAVLEVAEKSTFDVVLSTTVTWMVAHIVAEKVRVPLVLLTFQPDLRSRFVPHPCYSPKKAADEFQKLLNGESPNEDEENLMTYSRLHEIALTEFFEPLNVNRIRLGLAPIDEKRAADIVDGCAEVPSLVACSPQFSPAPPDWNSSNLVVGSMAASFKPSDYEPEKAHSELCNFLNDGPAPVVVSYGSMGMLADSKKLTTAILSGLRDANVKRVVLLHGSAKLDASLVADDSELAAWAKGAVITVRESVQYSYLLPRASVFLCHGGAGSVLAALYAGTPVVITPIASDQPFYAEMVTRLGLGAATTLGLQSLESEIVRDAVCTALSEKVAKNVRDFAECERSAVPPVTLVATKLAEIVEQSKK